MNHNPKLKFGLIGKNISYSFSKSYFETKFLDFGLNYSYDLIDIETIDAISDLLSKPNFRGFNVTIPYKESIIPFLDEISDEAKKIGAVNCISIQNNKITGYNTDSYGFEKTLLKHRQTLQKKALVLGNGGAAKAVKFVLEKYNIPYQSVARSLALNFENLSSDLVKEHLIIIQCTPVGTFPDISASLPFPFDAISENHLVIDLIYNPEETMFLSESKKRKAKTVNGYYMLEQQAEKAWKIWNFA